MKLVTTFLMLLLGTLAMNQARADNFRCDTRLVDVGASEYDLLEWCGEPSARDGSMWIYDRGPEKLKIIVKVGEGKVQSIQTETGEKP
jgi:hypothetical protein